MRLLGIIENTKTRFAFMLPFLAAVLAEWSEEFHIKVVYRVGAAFSTDIAIFTQDTVPLAQSNPDVGAHGINAPGDHDMVIGDA